MVLKSLVLAAVVMAVFLTTYYQAVDIALAQTSAFAAWIIGHVVRRLTPTPIVKASFL